jgi:hypothetical protein
MRQREELAYKWVIINESRDIERARGSQSLGGAVIYNVM